MSGSSTVDYKKLGLATGKSWRLGHPGADVVERSGFLNRSIDEYRVPSSGRAAFRTGFNGGVAAVDRERRKVK